jgi:hypothetical protein
MFQICVPDQKFKGKNTLFRFFLNVIFMNIKIHNILDIIEISKSMEPNKCIQKKFMKNVHLSVSYEFSKFDGSRKIKV